MQGRPVGPTQVDGAGCGRTATGWRLPLAAWLEDADGPGELVVQVQDGGRPVPASGALDRRTAGGTHPRRTPDGRWLLTWAATDAGVEVRRTPAPPRVPVTGCPSTAATSS